MTRAVVFLPARELTKWLGPATEYCIRQRYEVVAVVSDWDGAIAMLVQDPTTRVVTGHRGMLVGVEAVTDSPPHATVMQRRPQTVPRSAPVSDPSDPSQRRPQLRGAR